MSHPKSPTKSYNLFLPVWKQGDDLHGHLSATDTTPADAFLGLAGQYEEAARICRRVAGVLAETKEEVTVFADTHMISLEGNPASFAGLVSDGLLEEETWEDDEDPEDEEDEDSPEDEDFDDVEDEDDEG